MTIDSFENSLQAARQWMTRAYANLPTDYWNGRNAFTYCFDNFDQLAHYGRAESSVVSDEVESEIHHTLETHDRCAVYAGIPWCIQSCPFCDLAYARNPNLEQERRYISGIHQEVEQFAARGLSDRKINGVYFGGGTPTVLALDLLRHYIDGVLKFLPNRNGAVVTCEATPATITRRKLEYLATVANRISYGVQTLDTALSKREGRILNSEAVLERVAMTLEYFTLVNCDVIYGFRNETLEGFYDTLKKLVEFNVPSITLYRMELRPGTPRHSMAQHTPWETISEQNIRLFYFLGRHMLESVGYREQPLGWFIKSTSGKGKEVPWSQFVQQWGSVAPYFGFGQGSFSTSTSYWLRNSPNLNQWESAVGANRLPVSEYIRLSQRDQFLARFVRMIRSAPYLNEEFLRDNFPDDPAELQEFLSTLQQSGLATRDDGRFTLTDAGESLVHWINADAIAALSGRRSAEPVLSA